MQTTWLLLSLLAFTTLGRESVLSPAVPVSHRQGLANHPNAKPQAGAGMMRFKRMKTLNMWPEPCYESQWVPPQYIAPEFYPDPPAQCPVGSVPASMLAPPQVNLQGDQQGQTAYACWSCGQQFMSPEYYAQHIATCPQHHHHHNSQQQQQGQSWPWQQQQAGQPAWSWPQQGQQPATAMPLPPSTTGTGVAAPTNPTYSLEDRIYGLDQQLPDPSTDYDSNYGGDYVAQCSQCGQTFYTPVNYVEHLHHCGGEWIQPYMVSAGQLSPAQGATASTPATSTGP